MSKPDRHTCPACGGTDITTIHDMFYACNAERCAVHYDPERMEVTHWPVHYAIGFCPACGTNARENQCGGVFDDGDDPLEACFECPECEYFWSDFRLQPAEYRVGEQEVIPEAGMRVKW